MLKKIIINLLKVSIAVGLLYWLVSSGKLDFGLLNKLIASPAIVIIALIAYQLDQALVSVRLRLILKDKVSERLSLLKLYLTNWIGMFFSSVLPGSVTGDLVKILYIEKMDKNLTKKFLLGSVFLDRVVGLTGLVIVGGLTSSIYYSELSKLSTDVKYLIQANIFLMLLVFLGLGVLFLLPELPKSIFKVLGQVSFLKNIVEKIEGLWNLVIMNRKKITALIVMSMGVQSISMVIFWFLTSNFAEGTPLTFAMVFSVLPIGFISLAIPIAPAGMGVGHAVFDKLLGFFGITNGASLFNLFFFFVVFSNILGVLPYIFYSNKGDEKVDIRNLNQET